MTRCMDREGYSIETIEKVLANISNQSEAEKLMDFFIIRKGKVTEAEALEFSSRHDNKTSGHRGT